MTDKIQGPPPPPAFRKNQCSAYDQSGKREQLRAVTVQFVCPERWAKHNADKVRSFIDRLYLNTSPFTEVDIGLISDRDWEFCRERIKSDRAHFSFGEWVTITYCDNGDSMIPEFVKGTVGRIVGYRAGHATPWLVWVPTPAFEKNGTEWVRDDDPDRQLRFYYSWHDLNPITSLEQIPERHRKGAVLREMIDPPSNNVEFDMEEFMNDFKETEKLADEYEKNPLPAPTVLSPFSRAQIEMDRRLKEKP